MAKVDLDIEFARIRFKHSIVASGGHVIDIVVNLKTAYPSERPIRHR